MRKERKEGRGFLEMAGREGLTMSEGRALQNKEAVSLKERGRTWPMGLQSNSNNTQTNKS